MTPHTRRIIERANTDLRHMTRQLANPDDCMAKELEDMAHQLAIIAVEMMDASKDIAADEMAQRQPQRKRCTTPSPAIKPRRFSNENSLLHLDQRERGVDRLSIRLRDLRPGDDSGGGVAMTDWQIRYDEQGEPIALARPSSNAAPITFRRGFAGSWAMTDEDLRSLILTARSTKEPDMSEVISRPTAVEETALSRRTEMSGELAPTAAEAALQHEIQGAIVLARRFPRSRADAYAALLRSCGRTSFAEDACYSFPRGGIERRRAERAVCSRGGAGMGQLRYGLNILRDDEDSRDVEGWAWDIQSNVKVVAGDSFRKLIQRKLRVEARWVKPDERDLRELTNRRGAILVRNCILQLLPADFIEDAIEETRATLKAHAVKDPDGERKKVIRAFSDIGVSPAMLEGYLGLRTGPGVSPPDRGSASGVRLDPRWQLDLERVRRRRSQGRAESWHLNGRATDHRERRRTSRRWPPQNAPGSPRTIRPEPVMNGPATEADYKEIKLRRAEEGPGCRLARGAVRADV